MKKYYIIKFKHTDSNGPFLTTTDMEPVKWERKKNEKIKSNRIEFITKFKGESGKEWQTAYINAIKALVVSVKVIDFMEITKEEYKRTLSIRTYHNLFPSLMPAAFTVVGENQYKQFIKVID